MSSRAASAVHRQRQQRADPCLTPPRPSKSARSKRATTRRSRPSSARVMPEFGAIGDGFAINDPEVDWMSRAYAGPRSGLFRRRTRRRRARRRRGRAARTAATAIPASCARCISCRRCAASAPARALMERCLDAARAFGFARCYLETLRGMDAAMKLYERSGFHRIGAPLRRRPAMAAAIRSTCWSCRAGPGPRLLLVPSSGRTPGSRNGGQRPALR